MQQAGMLVFRRQDGAIHHFWATEGQELDMVWPYWNLMDLTPEDRPDRVTLPQQFTPEFFEKQNGNPSFDTSVLEQLVVNSIAETERRNR